MIPKLIVLTLDQVTRSLIEQHKDKAHERAVVEGVCAKWVQAVSDRKAARASVMLMIWAVALWAGLDQALHHGWPTVTWVLGCGAGSYLAVKTQ